MLVNFYVIYCGVFMKKLSLVLASFMLLLSPSALSAWQLNNDSSHISFISTKKSDIAEIHSFKRLAGSISDDAKASFTIDLSSVTTGIEIRDTRLQEMLFETGLYPKATFTADVSMLKLEQLQQGMTQQLMLQGELSLHGMKKKLTVDTLVSKLNTNTLLVVSRAPFIINAADFSLAEGVLKLKDVAKLASISNAVPVSFVLQFTQ